jgi:hypothetical protein
VVLALPGIRRLETAGGRGVVAEILRELLK